MDTDHSHIVDAMKAAGEPTRLRILALLRRGDLAVGELVQILEQSQPRLSHHLKTLTTAGLVERLPEGAWVFYRARSKDWAGRLLQAIFNEIDTTAAPFAEDREALQTVRQARAQSAESYFSDIAETWDQLRALHYPEADIEQAILEQVDGQRFDRIVDLGTGTGRMLTLLAPLAKEAEGLDLSHHMLTVARANLNRAEARNARVRQGDVTETPFDANSADLVVVHQVLHYLENPEAVLAEAARILRPGGRLLLIDFAPHDLEFLRETQGHRRLGIRHDDVSEWADAAGLALQAPLVLDPPASLDQGLSVLIWNATRPANQQEAAA
ncbi:MAG: metalloregulator ArsR/SmtB family transcription factor [Henriciella sp.]|nr:metalloregulator ArsR/SmtB family transcription factor [Henriciella sp.]